VSASTSKIDLGAAVFEVATMIAEVEALPPTRDPEPLQRRHNRLARLIYIRETLEKLGAGRVKGRPAAREITTELPDATE